MAYINGKEVLFSATVGDITLKADKLRPVVDRSITAITAEDLDGITALGDCAFYGCTSLTSAIIPEGVTSIGRQVFRNCTNLASIAIPASLRSVLNMVFSGCAINAVYITDLESFCKISWTENAMFSNGAALYLNGELVTDVVISSNITSILKYAFYKYTSLESVVFPAGITSIGGNAFEGCTALKTADFTACTAVPTLENQRGFYSNHADFVIKVPAALYDEWVAATNWSTKASQIIAV